MLARFARKLLADRREQLAEGDDRIRVMTAIAEVWRRVEAKEDLGNYDEFEEFGVYWFEMQHDLEVVAERARARAERIASRSDADERAKRSGAVTSALADALLFYHRPYEGGSGKQPMIAFCHAFNQYARASGKQLELRAA
ncbi:hypothetical protein [Sphingomonas koreensis]|nr:hypothetical protein [Sphingomonas koreensis]RSU31800.1 hypothetical protein CA225_00190 [Sphingomonas koreensis]RSU84531.1 hypothetical protein DAH54_04360 [Sphingomonas koreensis]RSU90358.1 hypothetical protein DAH52_20665 [Sphingomonas koreensis]RSV10889.1 hypothetical protein CA240_02390 [Sphingomonas koreensis]RSV52612.1 hypothetical protein CA229_18205 [Sphingomonas koreensis]